MTFAGWYRDAAFGEPCGVEDVDGFAYAKFVKVADLLTFRGCSFSERAAAPTKNAGLRFSYDITAPVGSSFVGIGMYGRFADKPEDKTFNMNTGSLRTDGHSDRDYAAAIKAAIRKEQSPASGE